MTKVGGWYENLRKPWWNPPNWIFGPAWTVILGLAAWSGVLAWTHATGSSDQLLIVILFGLNIVLHMLWSPEAAGLGLDRSAVSLAVDRGAHDRLGAVLDFGGVASVALPAMGDIRCLSQSYDRANEPAVW